MNKAGITAAIVASTDLTTAKAKAALEAVLKAMKQGLKEDRSVDLGRLGKLRTVKLTRGRRISRGLRNVGTSLFDYSKHAKTVKLKSKLVFLRTRYLRSFTLRRPNQSLSSSSKGPVP